MGRGSTRKQPPRVSDIPQLKSIRKGLCLKNIGQRLAQASGPFMFDGAYRSPSCRVSQPDRGKSTIAGAPFASAHLPLLSSGEFLAHIANC